MEGSKSKVIEWLEANDRRLWVERPRARDARKQCEEATGVKLTASQFLDLREEYCAFWGVRRFGSPYNGRALSERQWDRVAHFIRTRWHEMKDHGEEFIIRYMRSYGVPASREILAGCSTYKQFREGEDNGF